MTALRCENDTKRLISVFLSAAMLLSLAVLSAAAGYNTAYKIGDIDGNGIIDIVDATVIQGEVTSALSDSDGLIALRGDGNSDGLDIADATAVQRCALDLSCGYHVGVWVYPEAPTQAPSQKPTYDEYELPIVN